MNNPNEGSTAIGRTVVSMQKARSRYDDSIRWAQEANLFMLYALERIQRIRKAGIGGSVDMMLKEWQDAGIQMSVENPSLLAKLEHLPPLLLPEAEDEQETTGERGRNGRAAADSSNPATYGILFASARALKDAFSAGATAQPAEMLKKIPAKAASGMQGMIYKLWYMRSEVPFENQQPNQRAREVGRELLISDEVRWKAIIEACVEAGYLDADQGNQLITTKPPMS